MALDRPYGGLFFELIVHIVIWNVCASHAWPCAVILIFKCSRESHDTMQKKTDDIGCPAGPFLSVHCTARNWQQYVKVIYLSSKTAYDWPHTKFISDRQNAISTGWRPPRQSRSAAVQSLSSHMREIMQLLCCRNSRDRPHTTHISPRVIDRRACCIFCCSAQFIEQKSILEYKERDRYINIKHTNLLGWWRKYWVVQLSSCAEIVDCNCQVPWVSRWVYVSFDYTFSSVVVLLPQTRCIVNNTHTHMKSAFAHA